MMIQFQQPKTSSLVLWKKKRMLTLKKGLQGWGMVFHKGTCFISNSTSRKRLGKAGPKGSRSAGGYSKSWRSGSRVIAHADASSKLNVLESSQESTKNLNSIVIAYETHRLNIRFLNNSPYSVLIWNSYLLIHAYITSIIVGFQASKCWLRSQEFNLIF